MADPRLRILVPGDSMTVTVGQTRDDACYTDEIPAKEWCLTDDVLNVSDAMSFTVDNVDGRNAGKFHIGQKIIADEQHPDVASGAWARQFTGRITSSQSRSGLSGSEILITAMDLGWHLTTCHAPSHASLNSITFARLLSKLIHPSWGFTSTDATVGNLTNRVLKQGRAGILRAYVPPKTILPYIQVEPGQTPWDIIRLYAQREGFLVNVGARGDLILFQPDYQSPAPHFVEYHGSKDSRRNTNNLIGSPTLQETIDGLYSEIECWSTLVLPTNVQSAEASTDPNASYRHTTFRAPSNPLPFQRLHAFSDGEAINDTLRKNRALWTYQKGLFDSWQYDVELDTHTQNGTFFTSDSMIACDDSVNGVPPAAYYVQRVQRSMTMREGTRTKLTIRKPLLNPGLQALGGGAQRVTVTSTRTTTKVARDGSVSTVTVPQVKR